MDKRIKNIIIVSITAIVICLTVGISLAIFQKSKNGNDSKVIAGDIYMKYNNGTTKAITMIPSDTYREDDYYEFSINGKNTSNQNIVYDIVLNHGDDINNKTRLNDKFLRFRLVTVSNNVETEVVDEISYATINNTTIHVDTINGGTNGEVDTTYRLYTWVEGVIVGNVNQDYTTEQWPNVYTNINVSVTGDFESKTETSSIMINYNANGGTITNKSKYASGTTFGTLETPTKTNYIFEGWYLEDDFQTKVTSSTTLPNKNVIDLYANYTEKTVTITLDNQNPTNTPTSSLTYNFATNAITPSTITLPEKSYTVSGFNLDASRKSNEAIVSSNSNIISNCTFNGYYTASTEGSMVLENNTTPTLKENVANYTDNNRKWIKQDNTTLYARFEGENVTLPTITKNGYTCGFTESSSGTTITYQSGNSLTPTSDLTLYGVCIEEIYTITLNNQSATTPGSASIYEKYNIGYYTDSSATTQMTTSTNGITVPTKTGYIFGGYYTGQNGAGTQYIDATGKITSNASNTNFTDNNGVLYAKWTVDAITVSSFTIADDEIDIDATTTTTLSFTGTAQSVNYSSSNTEVASVTKNSNTSATVTGVAAGTATITVTLIDYANNETTRTVNVEVLVREYPIVYNLNGGTVSTPNPTLVTSTTETFTLNNPTKTGYTFAGWTGSNGNTPQTTVTVSKGSSPTTTVTVSRLLSREDFTTITDDETYPYTYDSTNNTWTSGNYHINSSNSTIIFNVPESGDYVINYDISCQKTSDYATFYVGSTSKLKIFSSTSGKVLTGTLDLLGLTTDDTIKVVYHKNATTNSGRDNVIFSVSKYEEVPGNTYTANWTPNTYTLTLNEGSSTGAVNGTGNVTATYDSSTISPSTITLASNPTTYTMSGFGLDASRKSNGATVSSTSTLTSRFTLTGYWSSTSGGYQVLNASTTASYNNSSGYVTSGKWTRTSNTTLYAQFDQNSLTLPTITKPGYTCGWTDSSSGTTITYASGYQMTPTASKVLYGVCTLNEITINSFTVRNVYIGKTKATSLNYTGEYETIGYSSTNTSVATIDSTGKITGVSAGTVSVTVTMTDYEGHVSSATISDISVTTAPPGYIAEDIISNEYTTGATSGLVAINTDGGLYNGTGTIREYRYSGVDSRWGGDVNNYITFNNEMWRIVGIFKGDTDDGANAWNIKIVRDYPIGSYNGTSDTIQVPETYSTNSMNTKTLASGTNSISASGIYPAFTAQRVYWNVGGTNANYAYPSASGILLWLNEESNTNSWYYKNYNTTNGINKEYKDSIATTTFYTRVGNSSTTVADEYNLERTTGTTYNGEPTYPGKIGMLYASDYAYASASTIWNGTSTTIYKYNYTGGLSSNKLNNWMLKPNDSSGAYWFISPSSYNSRSALVWYNSGYVDYGVINGSGAGVRPVLNLTSDTLIEAGGDGTYNNPYKIVATMTLSSNSGTVNVGDSTTITATSNSSGAYSCLSSNSSIATCSVSGSTITINGVTAGSANITVSQAATASLGATSRTYSVTVAASGGGSGSGVDVMELMCPGCLFTNSIEGGYTTWNTEGESATTAINGEDGVTDDYTELGNYFLGLITNDDNEVTNVFACGLYDEDPDKPFCIEGGTLLENDYYNYMRFEYNRNLLQSSNYWDGECNVYGSPVSCYGSVRADVYDNGVVLVEDDDGGCVVDYIGNFVCYE